MKILNDNKSKLEADKTQSSNASKNLRGTARSRSLAKPGKRGKTVDTAVTNTTVGEP